MIALFHKLQLQTLTKYYNHSKNIAIIRTGFFSSERMNFYDYSKSTTVYCCLTVLVTAVIRGVDDSYSRDVSNPLVSKLTKCLQILFYVILSFLPAGAQSFLNKEMDKAILIFSEYSGIRFLDTKWTDVPIRNSTTRSASCSKTRTWKNLGVFIVGLISADWLRRAPNNQNI